MKLLTKAQHAQLLANGRAALADPSHNPRPVVKLFIPDAGCTWLLASLDPTDEDTAFGLCGLGQGFPELGTVSLAELATVRGRLGLPIERDLYWEAKHPLSVDAAASRTAIVDDP
jgi:hypothetical protein